MLKQVSVYARNEKGMMRNITGLLAEENINILGSVTNDSAEYGIIRMVVSDPDKAVQTLRAAGFMCSMKDVLGVEMKDEVGSLHRLLDALVKSNVVVDYLYLSFNRTTGNPIMVFAVEDIWEVEECLSTGGFTVL